MENAPSPPGAPQKDPNGPFLLIMKDPHAKGGITIARYATKG